MLRLPVNEISSKQAILSLGFYPGRTTYLLESGETNEILAYGKCDFNFQNTSPLSQYQLEKSIPFFQFEFKKVWAFVATQQYALMPANYFSRNNSPHAMATVGATGLAPHEIRWDNSFMTNSCMVYTIPPVFEKMLSKQHKNASIREEKTVLGQALKPYAAKHNYFACINHCGTWFDLLIYKDGNLILVNSFTFSTISNIKEVLDRALHAFEVNQADVFTSVVGIWEKEQLNILEKHIPFGRIAIPFTGREQIEYFSTYSINK